MSDYTFRIRFWIPNSAQLLYKRKYARADIGSIGKITIRPLMASTFEEATKFQVDASGFTSADSAYEAGTQLIKALKFSAAFRLIALDFGHVEETVKACLTTRQMQKELDQFEPGDNFDSKGIQIFEGNTPKRAGFGNWRMTNRVELDEILRPLNEVFRKSRRIPKTFEVALDLWIMASLSSIPEARYILYYTALECITSKQRQDKSERVLLAIEQILEFSKGLHLSNAEQHSLRSFLNQFRQESAWDPIRRLIVENYGSDIQATNGHNIEIERLKKLRNAIAHGSRVNSIVLQNCNSFLDGCVLGTIYRKLHGSK